MNLRMITWNCAMSFRRKTAQLSALAPDIAVIQECERPDKWPDLGATSVLWHGDNPHKGLAVLAFGSWRVEPAPVLDAPVLHDPVQYVLPARVLGPQPFNLLGVWAKAHAVRERSYVGQVHAALDAYAPWLLAGPSVLAGDLNSNAIWDTPRRPAHARLTQRLADCGLTSAYHSYTGEAHGAETQPTLYLLKQARRPYHLDYLFLPQAWLSRLKTLQVGAADAWLAYSDHVPVVADVQL